MEWVILITWLLIINGALGGQYILNWMGNQERFVGNKPVGVSPGVMTWWREVSKFAWAFIAVIFEFARGKKAKYFWPGIISLITIMICGFTGVIENIGFFYLPRYYSPHIYAPYVNVYLAFLPFFGKFLFKSAIRKEHWIGISLVVLGLATPYIPRLIGGYQDPKSILDFSGIMWIIIINCCLCSQQVLNNKTVQTCKPGVGPNALVVWREIWKMIFISSALFIIPLIANVMRVHVPDQVSKEKFETRVLAKVDQNKKDFLLSQYEKSGDNYNLKKDLPKETETQIKTIFASTDYDRFFSLFEGNIVPKNWWPILFVVAAGLTGYIYSFGFFKLSKFAAHIWVPYTNVYLALMPFIMILFGQNVTAYQIVGAVVTTAGLMVGVSDYSRNKVVEIEKTYKEKT
jgi:drug/metabolite transporter (DMT)-like permease